MQDQEEEGDRRPREEKKLSYLVSLKFLIAQLKTETSRARTPQIQSWVVQVALLWPGGGSQKQLLQHQEFLRIVRD